MPIRVVRQSLGGGGAGCVPRSTMREVSGPPRRVSGESGYPQCHRQGSRRWAGNGNLRSRFSFSGRTRISRTRWVVAALLAACLLGACDDSDPKPDIADPTPSATSSSPTVSTPTNSPTASLGPDETVRAWVAAWNAALTSGDAASLSQYETPDCRNCDGLAKVIDDVTAAGGSFTGGMWSIVNSK